MATIGKAQEKAVGRLTKSGIEHARLEARILLGHVLELDAAALLAYPEKEVPTPLYESFLNLVNRRTRREPLAYLVGVREFWSLPFRVTPHTLIPRPDSETLVEAVLQWIDDKNSACTILDLGCGSGCLLLSLLHELPNATGTGVDISPQALDVSQENAVALRLDHRAQFIQGDWGNALNDKFDIIVCNPPYIPSEALRSLEPDVQEHEPHMALAGGEDGLACYRSLLPYVSDLLATDGAAFIEAGIGQANSIAEIASERQFQLFEIKQDLSEIDRCVILTTRCG